MVRAIRQLILLLIIHTIIIHDIKLDLDVGEIIIFTTKFNSKDYAVIGKISSKAFQTIQTSLKITEDSKYCFVGTRKGETLLYIFIINSLDNMFYFEIVNRIK